MECHRCISKEILGVDNAAFMAVLGTKVTVHTTELCGYSVQVITGVGRGLAVAKQHVKGE